MHRLPRPIESRRELPHRYQSRQVHLPGPGMCCSRRRKPLFDSRNESSKCVFDVVACNLKRGGQISLSTS
jgi:hypothetical protein